MTIDIILLDQTQLAFVNNFNNESPLNIQAIPCDYGTGECVTADVLTLEGFEDLATYLSGATITQVTITNPF
jgi:hypothetical protein